MEKQKLTPSQNDLMTYLNGIKNNGKVEVRYEDIATKRGLTGVPGIRRVIRILETKGWIKRESYTAGKNSDATPKLMTLNIL